MSCGYLLLANGKWRSPKFRYTRKSTRKQEGSTTTSSPVSVTSSSSIDGSTRKLPRLKEIISEEDNADDEACLQSSPGPRLCHHLLSSSDRQTLSSSSASLNGNHRHHHNNLTSNTDLNPPPPYLSSSSSPAPLDKYNGVYFGLLLAGVGFLLPYNSFVIAVDYFQDHFPGTSIMFDISFVYILSACLAVFINNLLVEIVPLFWRINFGYFLSFGTLTAIAIFEIAYCPFTQATSYSVILYAVGIIAFGCTIQQSSFYGYTSMLPTRYTQAVMTGESAAGLIVSVNRIITKLIFSDERINTLIFFGLSIGLIGCCIVIHNYLQKTSFVRYYIEICSKPRSSLRETHKPSSTLTTEQDARVKDTLEGDARGLTEGLSLVDYLETDQRSTSLLGTSLVPLGSPIMSTDDYKKRRWVAHSDSTEFDMPFGIDEEDLANYVPPVLPEPSWKREAQTLNVSTNTNSASTSKKSVLSTFNDKRKWKTGLNELSDPISWNSDGDLIEEIVDEDAKLEIAPPTPSSVTYKESSSSGLISNLNPRSWLTSYRWKIWKKRLMSGIQVRLRTSRLIWPYMVSICMAYMVTLSLFPGIEAEIVNCSLASWMPVILMATFNLTDFIGKIVASFAYNLKPIHLILISSIRFILIPCFALCVSPRLSPVFRSIFWPLFFSSILGFTNGIVGSLPMILAPSRVNYKLKELTGNLMTLSYSLGLTSGSAAAYLIDYILGPPLANPTAELCIPSINQLNGSSSNYVISK
ncbi:equilibrative nucleoside transporter 4-like [Panonychus citri]|uniref:equilibrative nucleoside transporter 4-like n=1 Tax=Panonychus citri TaxID=50023 RepID=UPI002307BD04|nr:equilibrative nucleoside transporter 4-like [Panonychus citri]